MRKAYEVTMQNQARFDRKVSFKRSLKTQSSLGQEKIFTLQFLYLYNFLMGLKGAEDHCNFQLNEAGFSQVKTAWSP